jgi:gliding motility-associated-like protein
MWVLADTTLLQSHTCDLQAAGVFTDIYTGQSGCDSVVIEAINYVPPDSTFLVDETCDPSLAGMFIEVLMNELGCDSFIIETIILIPSDTTIITGETCIQDSSGMFTKMLTNSGGCDSLVIETIILLPSDTTVQYQFTCLPQDTGIMEQLLINTYGCDSLLWTITSLAPPDSCLMPVIHREVFAPNVFSPNEDGINDFFFLSSHPDAITEIPILRIYDRWGGLVFQGIDLESNRPEQGWNGKIDGEFTNPGVFVWVAEVEYTDGLMETISGDVTIIR